VPQRCQGHYSFGPPPSSLTGGIQGATVKGHRNSQQGQAETQSLAHYLTVARELEQLQGASWVQRGAGAWGVEQAGTLVARAPPPRGGGGAAAGREKEGRERRGNSESGFHELRMREPGLGGRGQGELL
jgi:hypothetical protein